MSKTLNIPYHQQDWYPNNSNKNDGDGYCGAACAQMVLQSINAGVVGQPSLYNDAKNQTVAKNWYIAPDGLQWVMNDRRPKGFGGWFALYSLATEDAISRKIVWTICHYGIAPIANVLNGDHWVVVKGYKSSSDPTKSTDASYSIKSLDLGDPYPPVPKKHKAPPPPHDAMGKCNCGIGIVPATGENRGKALVNVSYSFWKSTYMTPVKHKYNTQWNGKFVAVCDPDPPAVRQGTAEARERRSSGSRVLTPEEAVEFAQRELEASGLLQTPEWQETFAGTRPGSPILVQRLDELDGCYFIVPFVRDDESTPGVVTVDGRYGDYQQIAGLATGGVVFQTLHQDEVRDMVVGHEIPLGGPSGTLMVRPEASCLYPLLVWQPCLESLSPLYPFFLFVVGSHRVYVRIDGEVFTELHTGVGGV